jgi:hypothetical protein
VVDEYQGIGEIVFTPNSPWQSLRHGLEGRVRNNRRHRLQPAPYIKLDLAVSIVGVVDSNGHAVPARICIASGTEY